MSSRWQPIDTQFAVGRLPVGVVALAADPDPPIIRSLLEGMGAAVHFYQPGTPGDFIKVLRMETDVPPYLIISGHGDDTGIIFGEYAAGIDTSMLHSGRLPAEQVARHVRLPGCVVIGLFCGSGEPAMAEAFLEGQLEAYIGMVDPNADFLTIVLFVAHFFYQILRHQSPSRGAWEQAASYDAWSRVFVYRDRALRHLPGGYCSRRALI